MSFTTVEEAINDIRNGKIIVVTDDSDRENEGDLICSAKYATPQIINFMASYAKGLICMPMSVKFIKKLDLPQMVENNTDPHATAFTVSIDHIETGTGISAFERSITAQKCTLYNANPEDFRRPGHMFPLEAKEGGVFERCGHTEATVDFLRIAGLPEVGLCCEIMDEDGTMMRGTKLVEFAKEHGLKMVAIKDLVDYRKVNNL